VAVRSVVVLTVDIGELGINSGGAAMLEPMLDQPESVRTGAMPREAVGSLDRIGGISASHPGEEAAVAVCGHGGGATPRRVAGVVEVAGAVGVTNGLLDCRVVAVPRGLLLADWNWPAASSAQFCTCPLNCCVALRVES
jgi:hypothetical protein